MSFQATAPKLYRFVRLTIALLTCALLLVLSAQGVGNALRNTQDLQMPAQYLMTAAQFLYVALGPFVVVVRLARPRWLRPVLCAWAICFVIAVATIPWAWIGPSYLQTLWFSVVGVACAGCIGFFVQLGVDPQSPLKPTTDSE